MSVTLQTYINRFVGAVGSKRSIKEATEIILEKMISYEKHELTLDQQAQARENIGIKDWSKYFGKTGLVYLEKGTHEIFFEAPFTDPYIVLASGHVNGMNVNVIIMDDAELDHFVIKIPVACFVRWHGRIIIEF